MCKKYKYPANISVGSPEVSFDALSSEAFLNIMEM
jgi:hypothetical protein